MIIHRFSWRTHCQKLSFNFFIKYPSYLLNCKSPKFSGTHNVSYNQPKVQTKRFFHREIYPKCADRMANSADPDQTAPLGAV